MLLTIFPRPRWRKSIAFRYLSIACGILVTTQVGLGLFQASGNFAQGLSFLKQKAEGQARFLSTVTPEAVLDMDFLALETLMRQTGRDRDFVYAVVLGPNEEPLTRFLDREHPLIQQALQTEGIRDRDRTLDAVEMKQLMAEVATNAKVYVIEKPITSGETFLGQIVLGYSVTNVQAQLYRSAALTILMAVGVSGLLAGVTIWLFERQVRTPLGQLAVWAQRFADGDLEQRVAMAQVNQEDEVGLLSTAFNTMADQLQNTLEGLQERNKTLAFTNAELARATRLKDEFLANMSHELRTPLNAVLGLSQALMEEIYGPLTEMQATSLQRILTSGEHLLSLINDILDLAKIESGKEELQRVPIQISVFGESTLDLLQHLADEKHISLTLNGTAVEPDWFEADERRIRQVLINLINNAIKFTPQGGAVTVMIQGDRVEEVLRFTVQDTGIGIAEKDMDELFEAFVQIESGLSRRYEGTGLGLALVRRIVELHGGSVVVESEVGVGSCFTVVLPWRNPENIVLTEDTLAIDRPTRPSTGQFDALSTLARTEPAPRISGENHLILIAEDNANNLEMLSDYLTFKGYQLTFAKNGLEAVSLAKEKKPQLILMDIHMPRMDGLEATRWIRADQDLEDIPIIALTALAMPGDREKCREAGLTDYITKPVNLPRLIQMMNKLLDSQSTSAST